MRRSLARILVLAAILVAGVAYAQFGVPWHHVPAIAVISAEGDPRLDLVDEAVSFWNKTLEESGSAFRLGRVERVARPLPEAELQALSAAIVGGPFRRMVVPQALQNLPGDLTLVLGESEFVSFAGPFDAHAKRVVGIRGPGFPPMNLPNVARNVIIHELGHAIGLGHNSDHATLMCGRPANCRPALFHSDAPRVFPLTEDEKRQLLSMYPADWKPR